MIIKAFCKTCNWTGQAIIGRVGFPLKDYECPDCGGRLVRGKGIYNYDSECAVLKKGGKSNYEPITWLRK